MNMIVQRERERDRVECREPESASICGVEKAGKMNATACFVYVLNERRDRESGKYRETVLQASVK